ncbi:uncharacterized protein METZ01_LOCUS441635, partial [marine metagenome]
MPSPIIQLSFVENLPQKSYLSLTAFRIPVKRILTRLREVFPLATTAGLWYIRLTIVTTPEVSMRHVLFCVLIGFISIQSAIGTALAQPSETAAVQAHIDAAVSFYESDELDAAKD